jgi:hypothetical protein
VLPEVSFAADFGLTKVAVKISNLSVKSSISVIEARKNIDKETWEAFWQLFNLIQENVRILG